MGIMEGRAPQQIRQKYNDLYKTALLTNWKVWPLAQVSYAGITFPIPHFLNLQSPAHQLSLHVSTIPSPIPVYVRRILDTLFVYYKFEGRDFSFPVLF